MAAFLNALSSLSDRLVTARAKVLAREDREMKAALIQLRVDAGVTQKQLADVMGVTQQAVHKLERYDSDPKLSTLRRYANAVGAIVQHTVTPDVGQSVWLAAAPRWDGSIEFTSSAQRRTLPASPNTKQWAAADAKRNDFALGA